jgi:hypothetical protein
VEINYALGYCIAQMHAGGIRNHRVDFPQVQPSRATS